MGEDPRRLALQLIEGITHCPHVQSVWSGDVRHPCREVVGTQQAEPDRFQVPEPWAGHLHAAPLLLVSSNPSISEDEPYPVWADSAEHRTRFFDERFGDGPTQVRDGVRHPLKQPRPDGSQHSNPVAFWRDCRDNVKFLLDRDPVAGDDYVMTEVVRCKSRSEKGVRRATNTCVEQWFGRTLALSPATVVIAVGAVATAAIAEHAGVDLPFWEPTRVTLGGRTRLVIPVRHPNFHGPRKWRDHMSAQVVSILRDALDVAHESSHSPAEDPAPLSSTTPPLPSALDEAITRTLTARPGEVLVDDQGDQLELVATANQKRFSIIQRAATAGEDATLIVWLDSLDANRAQADLGGYLDQDDPDDAILTIEGTLLNHRPDAADRLFLLLLRCLHFATAPRSPAALTIDDMVTAIIEDRRFKNGPDDMHSYWSSRRAILQELFTLDTPPLGGEFHDVPAVVETIADSVNTDSHPLSGTLEMPLEISRAIEHHHEELTALERRRQDIGHAMMRDLLTLLRPDLPQMSIAAEQLARRGVAPKPPRDEVQLVMDGWF